MVRKSLANGKPVVHTRAFEVDPDGWKREHQGRIEGEGWCECPLNLAVLSVKKRLWSRKRLRGRRLNAPAVVLSAGFLKTTLMTCRRNPGRRWAINGSGPERRPTFGTVAFKANPRIRTCSGAAPCMVLGG